MPALRRPPVVIAEHAHAGPNSLETDPRMLLPYRTRFSIRAARYLQNRQNADASLRRVFRSGNARVTFPGAVCRSAVPASPQARDARLQLPCHSLAGRIVTESPLRTATEKTLSDISLTRKYSARAAKKR
jgi:hypothetical protein